MTRFIVEIFDNIHSAEQAYQAAIGMGYQPNEINLVMSEETRVRYQAETNESPAENSSVVKDVLKGSAAGGAIGATFGILTAIAAMAIVPGLGIVIAGPIFGGLASTGAGIVGGGLIGLLGHEGMTEEEAKKHEQKIKDGGIMIAVKAKDEDANLLKVKWEYIKS